MAHIILHILPEHLTWAEFLTQTPENSIALDGFCEDSSKSDLKSKHFNFDHHTNCDRLSTRCTTKQVIMAIKQGLLESIKGDLNIFMNDADEDCFFSWYFLCHPEHINILKNHIDLLDILDTTGGFTSLEISKTLNDLNWMTAPYKQARILKQVSQFDEMFFRKILKECEQRVLRFVKGEDPPEPVEVLNPYTILYQGNGWVICEEHCENARILMANSGVQAFVCLKGKVENTFQYSIGRKSKYIDFPIDELYLVLSKKDHAKWGGSDLIGGSNRFLRSCLSPSEIGAIIDQHLGGGE